MGTYESALASLNDAQRQAVTAIDGPVLVIAGPGTGKTQLLSTRIAYILSTTDTLPENILCLTFTDSAAQNMRQRLSNMIGQAAYKITISTYHAFGSDLIKRFPDYFAGQGGDLQPIDDLGIDATLRNIIGDLPYGNPLKFADSYLRDVITFISDAKRALLTPDDVRRIAHLNLASIEAVKPLIAEHLGNFTRMGAKSVPLFEALAHDLRSLTKQGDSQEITPLIVMAHTQLNEALSQVEETGKTTPLTKWKNTWLVKDTSGTFTLDGVRTNQRLLACADIYESYLQSLEQRQLFDYDDMILRAITALQQNDDLRFTLQEQYQYILLDEFQDTNGAQLRLVELLTDNPILEGRPNVLAVGDDDQAIYAFQGADYSHMLKFQKLYRDVLPVALTKNYRSHADVLHTARGIAEQIEERLHHHFPQIEKTLEACNKKLPATATIERHHAQSDMGHYAWTAHQITTLIAAGTPAHEIAVLAPQHKYLEPLVPYLQQAGIAVHYDKRENVLDDPAVAQLITMSSLCLRLAAKDPGSNQLWSEVLSFPFWQLPTSLIWKVSWQASSQRTEWSDILLEHDQLRPIALFFMRLSMLTETETMETMLDYLIGTTPLDLQEPGQEPYHCPLRAYYFEQSKSPVASLGSFWNTLSNLTVLRTRLRHHIPETADTLHLSDFIAFVEAHRAANIKIQNTSPYQNGDDAVQLMTAYKAKGMEFDAVFVLATTDEAWGGRTASQSSRLPLPPNLAHIRYAGATNDERLRLFYVALTRAKTKLYLVSYQSTYAGKHTTRLQYLNEVDQDGQVLSPLLPPATQVVLPAEEGPIAAAEETSLEAFWQQRHIASSQLPQAKDLLHNRLSTYQLSPTHLNAFIDIEHGGPQQFFLQTILRFPQSPTKEGQFGNAMHETMEWIHVQNKKEGSIPSEEAVLAFFERQMLLKRLSRRDTMQLIDKGKHSLRAYLQQRAHTIHADDLCESDFRNDGIFIGEAHLTGKIDKLIINKQERTITIVDYKTGHSHQRWAATSQLHKYRQQLYLYKTLVERSSRFKDYRVTDAYLEFIVPDDEGAIHELHLTFDADTERTIHQLVQCMWRRIQALDLPDISAFAPSLAGMTAFEAFLLQESAPDQLSL